MRYPKKLRPRGLAFFGGFDRTAESGPMKNRMNDFVTPAALISKAGSLRGVVQAFGGSPGARFVRDVSNEPNDAMPASAVRKRSALPIEKHAYQPGTEPQRCIGLPTEIDRVRLIGELSRILHEPEVPDSMKAAGLTLIGWLARRMPGEDAHALGVPSSSDLQRSGGTGKKRR